MEGNTDILCLAETELDESFPNDQIILEGCHNSYRLDIIEKKGGLMVFIKLHISF